MKKILVLFTILLILFNLSTFGQEEDFDEDSLFGEEMVEESSGGTETDSGSDEEDFFSDDMVEEIDESSMSSGLDTMLLTSDALELGGSFSFSLEPLLGWVDPDLDLQYVGDNFGEPDISTLSTNLSATLFFDARPDENFRVFGKGSLDFQSDTTEKILEKTFTARELFADFNWNNTVFFRVGKQNAEWGVGYFFSPADVLSLIPIDPENPTAEREGPIAIKTHIPIDIHNFYLYIVTNEAFRPEEIAVAPKFEFVIDNMEVGFGGFIRKDVAPMGMLTLTFPFFDINVFGEAVVSYGANKKFIEEGDFFPEVTEIDDQVFFTGTIGGLFSLTDIDSNYESVSLAAQYLYNGYGYDDLSVFENKAAIGGLIVLNQLSYFDDVMNRGRHYLAANLSWSKILDSDIGLSVYWRGNLSDGSGLISPTISWSVIDYVNFSLGAPIIYGDEFDEFSYESRSFSLSFNLTLGSGRF